jgi:hypothetical protein
MATTNGGEKAPAEPEPQAKAEPEPKTYTAKAEPSLELTEEACVALEGAILHGDQEQD